MSAEKSSDPEPVVRPGPRIGDHQATDELGPATGQAEPDGAAPGVAEDHDSLEAEPIDEPLDDPRMRPRPEVVPGGRLRQAKPRVVRSHAAERAAKPKDHVAPTERPARVAIQEEDRWTVAFVDVVDEVAVDLGPAILNG